MEGHLMPDHVHMLAGIPPRIGVSGFMGCLKGKGSLPMSGRHASLKCRSGSRKLWEGAAACPLPA